MRPNPEPETEEERDAAMLALVPASLTRTLEAKAREAMAIFGARTPDAVRAMAKAAEAVALDRFDDGDLDGAAQARAFAALLRRIGQRGAGLH